MILLLGDTGGGRGHLMGGARRVRGGAVLKAARLSLGMLPGRELTSTRLPHTRLSVTRWSPPAGSQETQGHKQTAPQQRGRPERGGRSGLPPPETAWVSAFWFSGLASPTKGQEAGAFAPDPPHSMSTRRC